MHSSTPSQFDWSEYLNLAYELAGENAPAPSNPESKFRTSISRAYYAAFCKTRNHLRDVEGKPVPPSGAAHNFVRKEIEGSPRDKKKRRQIAKNLERLHLNRKEADYEDSVHNLQSIAVTSLRLATKLMSTLNTI